MGTRNAKCDGRVVSLRGELIYFRAGPVDRQGNAMAGFTTRPEIRGTFGVVASTHWLASAVGMSMLERGGNAFDAAAAAGFTLQVVEPHLNGPLGDNPILVWNQKTRRAEMICGQGPAPAGATIAHYKGLG